MYIAIDIGGMKTCLVWSETKSNVADVTLRTAYEVATIIS